MKLRKIIKRYLKIQRLRSQIRRYESNLIKFSVQAIFDKENHKMWLWNFNKTRRMIEIANRAIERMKKL